MFVANSGDDTISRIVVSPGPPSLSTPIALRSPSQTPGVRPQNLAFSPDHGHLYVSNLGAVGFSVLRIGTQVGSTVEPTNPLVPSYGGTLGLAVDATGMAYATNIADNVLFKIGSGCFGNPVGEDCLFATTRGFSSPYGVAAAPDGFIYVSNIERDQIAVVRANDLSQVSSIPAGSGRSIVAAGSDRLVVANAQVDTVSVLYREDCGPLRRGCDDLGEWCHCVVTVGDQPEAIAVHGDRAYVTNRGGASFSVVDLTGRPIQTLKRDLLAADEELQARPFGVAVDDDGRFAYITGNLFRRGAPPEIIEPGVVWIIDIERLPENDPTPFPTIQVGYSPRGIVVGEVPCSAP